MKTCAFCILLFFMFSCKKEGLSKDTGNLEITINNTNMRAYEIYTEEQYYRFINYQWPFTSYRAGAADVRKIVEKGLPKGSYGIFVFGNGDGYKKLIYIAANKVNKITMP